MACDNNVDNSLIDYEEVKSNQIKKTLHSHVNTSSQCKWSKVFT